MPPPTVFISYSHKDEEWYDKIMQAMEHAAVSVCLISADYLASDFCVKEEIPYPLERCTRGRDRKEK